MTPVNLIQEAPPISQAVRDIRADADRIAAGIATWEPAPWPGYQHTPHRRLGIDHGAPRGWWR